MTTREEAINLVEMFDETLTYLESKNKAKECALICVDEILKSSFVQNNTFNYWQEVKQEINKL